MRLVTNSHRSMSARVPRLGYAAGSLSVSVVNIENSQRFQCLKGMAERVGFEPTIRFPVCSLSRRVLSTTQSPLRSGWQTYFSKPARTRATGRKGGLATETRRTQSEERQNQETGRSRKRKAKGVKEKQ